MAIRKKPWKALFSEGLVQLAVVLSILRTDVRQYLRNYSHYPEIQQVLQGETVGLNLVENYHHNIPRIPSKYNVDDVDIALSEINRLISIPNANRHQLVDAWLVTESTSSSSPLQVVPQAGGGNELTRQDIDLIEGLWKQDIEPGAGNIPTNVLDSEYWSTSEQSAPCNDFQIDNTAFGFGYVNFNNNEEYSTPSYQTQSSLDLELQNLEALDIDLNPMDYLSTTYSESDAEYNLPLYPTITDTSEAYWDNSAPLQRQLSMDSSVELNPSLLDDLNIIDADMINGELNLEDDLEEMFPSLSMRKSISEDSAYTSASSSPSRSWSDRLSESSEELGAVGYTDIKPEPFFDAIEDFDDCDDYKPLKHLAFTDKSVVSHDHTYGAPPGGVPHVRKMDIKTPKEPTRGFAHDEVMIKKLRVPFSVEKIVNAPVDEFNKLLQKHPLNGRQAKLVKDIRRRGKNKVAAQNCRMKKIDELTDLESEVEALRLKRDAMKQQKAVLSKKSSDLKKRIDLMSSEIFNTLRNDNGVPYSLSSYSLEVGANGEVHVISSDENSRISRKGNSKKSSRRQ